MEVKIVDFPIKEFINEKHDKTRIILHHTVSSSKDSTINWWKQDPQRIATAFVLDKDGVIYQLYDPACWAYHIGKGSTSDDNKKSIGIEIVNEGRLSFMNGKYYWLDGKAEFKGKVYEHPNPWRGSKYYAQYTDAQVKSVNNLLGHLLKMFKNIKPQFIGHLEYDPNWKYYSGIVSHTNLRKDKSDISIAYPTYEIAKFLNTYLLERKSDVSLS